MAIVVNADSLRAARAKHGLSLRGLSRLSGVSRRTIQRIEEGAHPATRAVLNKLEEALQRDEFAIKCAALGIEPGSPEELWSVVPWELDPCSRYVVACHPDGLTYEQIGRLLDMDPRTVAELERNALEKLRSAANSHAP